MNRPTIPSQEELKALPRWARAAFVARCARRVLPLAKHFWGNVPEHHLQDLDRAVSVAERAAATSAADAAAAADATDAAHRARDASRAVHANRQAIYRDLDFSSDHANNAAVVISCAAESAACLYAPSIDAGVGINDSVGINPDVTTAYSAVFYASRAFILNDAAARGIRSDFDILLTAARDEGWDDRTPVPPEFFGPLWPNGTPLEWPIQSSGDEKIVLEIEIPEGATDEEAAALARHLADRADDFHRARGGHGLKVETVTVFDDTSGSGRKAVAS